MIRLTVVCAAMALFIERVCLGHHRTERSRRGEVRHGRHRHGRHQAAARPAVSRVDTRRAARKDLTQNRRRPDFIFDTDQSVVTDQGRETLDRQVQWLRQKPRASAFGSPAIAMSGGNRGVQSGTRPTPGQRRPRLSGVARH